MYVRQTWLEDRLVEFAKSKVQVLQREHISHLWLPDPYCYNAKKSDMMLPDTEIHSVVRIDQDGFVMYSRRSVALVPLAFIEVILVLICLNMFIDLVHVNLK